MSDRRARLISRLKNRAKDGKTIFNNITIPQPVDNRTPQQKRIDREIAKKKEEEDAIKLIEENKEKIFNLSFEKQDWEHEWNLEEYQKDRIWRYEDEYPRDESYEGVAQWCICYKCRPEWHSQPGGVIYINRERNKEQWEIYRMNKEDSERERQRLKKKANDAYRKKLERRRVKKEAEEKARKEKEEKEKEELHKKLDEQEKEYRKFLIEEKDKERENIIESKGWSKKVSKSNNKIYWYNSKTKEKIWDKDMNVDYNVWLEFYSNRVNKILSIVLR